MSPTLTESRSDNSARHTSTTKRVRPLFFTKEYTSCLQKKQIVLPRQSVWPGLQTSSKTKALIDHIVHHFCLVGVVAGVSASSLHLLYNHRSVMLTGIVCNLSEWHLKCLKHDVVANCFFSRKVFFWQYVRRYLSGCPCECGTTTRYDRSQLKASSM